MRFRTYYMTAENLRDGGITSEPGWYWERIGATHFGEGGRRIEDCTYPLGPFVTEAEAAAGAAAEGAREAA